MKVFVSIKGGHDYKLWGKAVTDIDLSKNGGFALVGLFVGAIPEAAQGDDYTLTASVPDGAPFVIACTFSEKGKKDSEVDRVCFLVVPNKGGDASASYIAATHSIFIRGDITIWDYHGTKAMTVDTTTPQGVLTTNPLYWAAMKIHQTPVLYDNMVKLETPLAEEDKPLRFYGRRSERIDGRMVTMPSGYEFTEDLGGTGIWLIACTIPGKKKLQFADIFANVNDANEDLAWFLNQQAVLLRGLAMTYEIIAMAKSGKEL